MEENIYNKQCLICGSEFIGNNSDKWGICPNCEVVDNGNKKSD